MSAPFPLLVRLRAGELADGLAARARSSPVPAPATLARAVARVALAQAAHLDGRVLAYPAELRVFLTPAGYDRMVGAAELLETEVADRAWARLRERTADEPSPGRFRVRLGLDVGLDAGFRIVASRALAPPPPPRRPPMPASPVAVPPAPALRSPEPAPARTNNGPVVATTIVGTLADGGPEPALRLRGLRGAPVVTVPAGVAVSVGRGRDNDVVVADPRASGRHLAIGWRGAVAVAADLGSTNGTWHNGRRVAEAALGDGDRLRVGRTVLVVDLPTDPSSGPATEPDETRDAGRDAVS